MSIQSDGQFLKEASNIVEALCNLTYLICEEAEHPGKVRHFASMSEERLSGLKNEFTTETRKALSLKGHWI